MKAMLLLLISIIVFAWFSTRLSAEELQVFTWTDLKTSDPAGEVTQAESPQKGEILKVENSKGEPNCIQLLEIKDPSITDSTYAVRGDIRYEDVKGISYLEMWNYFPDGSQYFTRTLADRGLLQHLQGTSAWRPFALPFSIGEENSDSPSRLVVNLVLEGSGTVYLSPLRLEQYVDLQQALMVPGAWWGSRTGGMIGGILGGLLGGLGGLIGILASRGRGRKFVMISMLVFTIVGIIMTAIGMVALLGSQPYEVWYPLLLVGIITTVVFIPLRSVIRRRYENWELQQIAATDLGITSS